MLRANNIKVILNEVNYFKISMHTFHNSIVSDLTLEASSICEFNNKVTNDSLLK